ncbi:hypothetical protein GCM10027341_02380 [Spirosoma knui]
MNYVTIDQQATTFLSIGRGLFALGIVGIGLIHFFFPGLQPLIAPLPAEEVWPGFGYAVGAVLTVAGVGILLNQKPKTLSFFLAILLILFVVFGHLPNRLVHHPEILGYWTDTLKLMALAGGAFALSITSGLPELPKQLARIALYGRYVYALMLILFGIDHFIYSELVKSMVPGWIPAPLFWTYATGLALIGSGLSIVTGFRATLIMLLLAIMLLSWLVLLHIPDAINHSADNAIAAISSLECLAFSGIALLLADFYKQRDQVPTL